MFALLRNGLVIISCLAGGLYSAASAADGITLGGTRIIYPVGQKQTSITVRNTSDEARYLVQSWAENAEGKKTNDFIVTPPVYVSNPKNENALRLMYVGPEPTADRETLYYLTAKAIPALDKAKTEGKNVLVLAASTRIKMFVRPKGLTVTPEAAQKMLKFTRAGNQLTVNNPSPYYITLVQVKADGKAVDNIMAPPKGTISTTLPSAAANKLTFQTVNDYGGMTEAQNVAVH